MWHRYKKTKQDMNNPRFFKESRNTIFVAPVVAGLALYAFFLSQLAFDPDLAILTSFAERMLQGYRFTDMYYEANPPLSIILYIPAVWIGKLTGLPIYHATFVYTTLLLGVSCGLSYAFLRRLRGLDKDLCQILALGYLVLVVVVPAQNYGDRDHLCLLGVTLLLLAQLALLQGVTVPRGVQGIALVLGTVFILVKPHYGLIPAVLIAYRFFRKDGFRVIIQPDFVALAAGVLIYTAVLVIFFTDYLQIALMDSLRLYAGIRVFEANKFILVFGMILLVFLGILNSAGRLGKEEVRLVNILGAITLLLFIPYYVQGKGFDYHKIPVYVYWFLTLMTGVYVLARAYNVRPVIAKPLILIILIVLLYNLRGITPLWLTHKQFEELPLLVTVNKYCPEPCNYLVLSDTSDDNHRISNYGGHFHASRFTSMWFLGYIFYQDYLRDNNFPATVSQEDYNATINKYIGMIEDDFKRMPPDIIIELKNLITYKDVTYTEFLFKHSPSIYSAFENDYEVVETLEFDRRLYYPGLRTPLERAPIGRYVVYKRKGFDGHNPQVGRLIQPQ